jgi:3-hydroxyacyl-[acyl-carrier-protein] dehydratase
MTGVPMTAADRRSPVLALSRVERLPVARDDRWTAATSVWITHEEPVFAGHYPEFPIFPGVCIVDCVIGGALAAAPPDAGRLGLEAVESARFVGAVYPDDRLDISLDWRRKDGSWRCAATASTERGDAASVRLTFRQVP